jgi:hypothetical protein
LARFDRIAIAERLRELVGGPHREDLGEVAARLGLEELSLRMSIDEESPHPTVEVLAAVIRQYGIDPTWLLTGVYDASTHRSSMEDDQSAAARIREFMGARPVLIAEPTPEHLRLHGQN